MKFILDCLKGIILGAGAILPGISSGVFCATFGIYEKLIDSILYFFKDIKGNIIFLLPFAIGVTIGAIIFGNLLTYLFNDFPTPTKFCFIGLILGSIPALLKTANAKKGFRLHYLIYAISTFFLAILLLYLEKYLSTIALIETCPSFLFLVFSGFIMSIGVVVPGISSSVLLMILGIYNTYLLAVSTVDFSILAPMGIGLIIGGYTFLLITKYFLENFHAETYYAILGFVLGSLFILYPGFKLTFQGILSIILLFAGFFCSTKLEKKQ